ncbi:UNVERIFIED_CONTAM: cap guanine-N7 methyltransferase 2 [Sesamum radiatum]|uniref:mRNA (guanine-N(7))-methyltransferase n=1 Tax=Sesamum radiatum TaxID=300843 RepID=A0AAW2JWD0_SESRA
MEISKNKALCFAHLSPAWAQGGARPSPYISMPKRPWNDFTWRITSSHIKEIPIRTILQSPIDKNLYSITICAACSWPNVLLKSLPTILTKVCDLYCGKVPDEEKWDEAQIGHYIGIDVATSGVSEVRAWESRRKAYTSEFLEFDPCIEDVDLHWKNKENQADIVFCMQHLPLCVETEEKVRRLLHNVSSLLKPGGYFLGITPDSSTIWAKYQKNVEAYHNKSAGMKPNIFPNCIRSESYMITFEVEEENMFPFFGKKYQLKFAGDMSAETHCLVHFPSLIRLAREAGLEYVEIQNLTEFYDDNSFALPDLLHDSGLLYQLDCSPFLISLLRAQLAGMLMDAGHNLVDQRGRLLQRSYDVLGLYTTFIFQKPDPDIAPPLMTPLLEDASHNHDEASFVTLRSAS